MAMLLSSRFHGVTARADVAQPANTTSALRQPTQLRPRVVVRRPVLVAASSTGGGVTGRHSYGVSASKEGILGGTGFPLSAASSSRPNVVAKAGGEGSSLGATLERAKLEFVMPTPVSNAPKLDDSGNGGDIGKIIHNGGGGGGGDDDDDDDYFNEGDGDGGDGDGEGSGDGFFRVAIPESYDKFSIGAVLSEWMRTVSELPLILRRAVEMGLFSSAQLVRFFAMDVRPNLTRAVSRNLPPTLARDFVGRLMADPAFVQKLAMESAMAAFASLWYEWRARGERFFKEFDLVMVNTLGMAAATGATAWLVAPSRAYGSVHKFGWQQMLDGLPNCVFDASGPLRHYTKQARVGAFFAKAAELSAVGALTGTVTSLLSSLAVAVRKRSDPTWEPSVAVPAVGRASGGLAAFFAVNANTRYQLLGGMDGYLFNHSNYLWTYLGLSGLTRLFSNAVGEMTRPWCQGLPEPQQARQRQQRRQPAAAPSSSGADIASSFGAYLNNLLSGVSGSGGSASGSKRVKKKKAPKKAAAAAAPQQQQLDQAAQQPVASTSDSIPAAPQQQHYQQQQSEVTHVLASSSQLPAAAPAQEAAAPSTSSSTSTSTSHLGPHTHSGDVAAPAAAPAQLSSSALETAAAPSAAASHAEASSSHQHHLRQEGAHSSSSSSGLEAPAAAPAPAAAITEQLPLEIYSMGAGSSNGYLVPAAAAHPALQAVVVAGAAALRQ